MKQFKLKTMLLLFLLVTLLTITYCWADDTTTVDRLADADNNEIVNIGDSIYALSGDIYTELEAKSGETWRHYAISGAQITGDLLAEPIPDQYADAVNDDPNIRVVYMNGGGNDILIPSFFLDPYNCRTCNYWWCRDLSQRCKDLVDDTYVTTVDLLNQMDDDGVEHVVYLGYYRLTTGDYGNLTKLDKAVAYGNEKLTQACVNSTVDAEFVDPTDAFKGNESDYIKSDGIHPTEAGSAVLADMLWDALLPVIDN